MDDRPSTVAAIVKSDFEWSVRALAQPPTVQLSLFPDFACKADELALDFDEKWTTFRETILGITESQAQSIMALDEQLASMSGPENAELWTDHAVESAPQWIRVRELATRVLEEFGWSFESPPLNRAIYVGPADPP